MDFLYLKYVRKLSKMKTYLGNCYIGHDDAFCPLPMNELIWCAHPVQNPSCLLSHCILVIVQRLPSLYPFYRGNRLRAVMVFAQGTQLSE